MTKRRDLLAAAPAAWALLGLSPAAITVPTGARADDTAAPDTLWRSPTLREETVPSRPKKCKKCTKRTSVGSAKGRSNDGAPNP